MKKKITIIGLGYVGLPTLLLFSENNKFDTYGYDNNNKILNDIAKGKTKINEKNIRKLLKNNIKKKNLQLSKNFILVMFLLNCSIKYK